MNLSSFDVGFLIATIFGKLKLPPKVDLRSEFKDHKFCILDTQSLYSGKARSGICILETQDLGYALRKHRICYVSRQEAIQVRSG